MNCLGEYASDEEDDINQTKEVSLTVVPKRKIEYGRLPISRSPLLVVENRANAKCEPEPDLGVLAKERAKQEIAAKEEEEVIERKVAMESNASASSESESEFCPAKQVLECGAFGELGLEANAKSTRSASWLPSPRAISSASDGEVQIDFACAGRPREKPMQASSATSWLIQAASAPEIEEDDELPENILKHPMFKERKARKGGMSSEDIHKLRSASQIKHISAEALKDTNWHENSSVSGCMEPPRGKRMPAAMSMYDHQEWDSTTHANPSKVQKRKHQINWLAHEAIEKEAELLDRAASTRLTKSQTLAKYGW